MICEVEQQLHLDLFDEPARWPRRPYCSDDLEYGVRIRSLSSALKKAYIQANPPHLRVWSIFDVDRAGAGLAWEDAMLPPPSWTTVNKENGHAHLVWGLSAPVLVDSPDMRQAPLRYLCAVEAAFRASLQADSGYSGLITKNPAHPLWRTLRGPQMAYELGELADWVDLPKHVPRRKPEEVGVGRNVAVFDWLRLYAYKQIRHYKGEVRNFVYWQSHLNNKALERNGDLNTPMDGREVWHIAKSVSKWVWRTFDIAASDARFSALQAHRGAMGGSKNASEVQAAKGRMNASEVQAAKGRASGMSRLAASEDQRASARLMHQRGLPSRAIAAELGVNQSTVVRWLR